MNKISFLLMLVSLLFLLTACGNNDDNNMRNIEQIHQEDGIPVKVEEIVYQPFSLILSYNANLNGIRETTVTSLLSDRVETVLVKVGDYVEKDQLLLTFPEDSPSAQYRQAKAAFESSEQTYQRMSVLFAEGGISRQELDQLETMKSINQANYLAASKMIYIKASIAGYVTQINFRETETANFGDPLITISQIDRYRSKVWVIERDINAVRPGLGAVARWQEQELPGRVVQVARSIDGNRQAFGVDLEFDNPENLLLSGVMVSIDIITYGNDKAIIVPRQYIQSDIEGDYVFIVANGNAVKRYVKLGANDRMVYEIAEGLAVGDILIKEGSQLVSNGIKIRIES
ncbi:MAG: efflux RND transporter periplasmic adaptor subunit [Candidatus Cloacimonetes bacterium]|nr:efflux RND transporter periplasmic adaptor subunit [Candidatus Cloacimonadota bacterium]